MKRTFFVGIVLALAALPATACGDDDDGGDGGNGDDGENVECTPGEGGSCQNETDCVVVENGEARLSARTCGLGCQQDMDPATCAVTCIVDDIEISQACATCYAALVGCAAMLCPGECGTNPASDECTQCQIDEGCRASFDSCSGLTTVP
jgi:hypothetical protein